MQGGDGTIPEVGDLLRSMSIDCWLSDNSVRPVVTTATRVGEGGVGVQSGYRRGGGKGN